ncbi:MAG: hypothetical protein E7H38_07950 [Varibaculum cambriense]|uniref:hypothetical protein n=1 Tax=Varibaculum cambriense TaxID=184870 RepID=UPI002910B8B4|nr:hypothetical protein [Varibaculum cambriense]MDU4028287.1 hypothetical protein [Varibaculum cambriense]
MSSREYMDTMLDIETTAMGLGNAADYAQELAKKLGYTLGKTEGYLQAATPEFLIKFPIIIDEQIDKSIILAGDLETIASQLGKQITTIKKLIATARTLANSEEAGNAEK